MQFSKFMPSVCAAVFCAGLISVHAQDNPAQAAARAALEEKMQQLNAQPTSSSMTPPPAVAATPSGAAQAQPAATVDAAAQARAMEALQEKMAELDRQQKAEATAAATPDNAAQAATLAALEEKMRELNAQQAATNTAAPPAVAAKPPVAPPVQAPVVATPPQATANYPGKVLGLPPITAPPLPISAEQETELQGLLMRYEANQISPEEYQKERAKILANP